MNIDDLTLEQIDETGVVLEDGRRLYYHKPSNKNISWKEIQGMCRSTEHQSSGIFADSIGKYVIIRSRNEGINAGKLLMADETGVVLEDARRLYYHKPSNKNISWYEGVAVSGISSDSKVGEPVRKVIIEDYSITECSAESEKSIRQAKTNAQG